MGSLKNAQKFISRTKTKTIYNKMELFSLLINFLPMVLLYLIATYSPEVARISHTVLGKTFAVVLILFYTYHEVVAGLLVCALIIFYYQTDYVESFHDKTIIHDEVLTIAAVVPNGSAEKSEKETALLTPSVRDSMILADAYPEAPIIDAIYDDKTEKFRQKNCDKNGNLVYKGQVVNPEMAEHVFSNIQTDDFHKCNVCDSSCEFRLVDERIQAEENLVKPKSSNDFFEIVWRTLQISSPLSKRE